MFFTYDKEKLTELLNGLKIHELREAGDYVGIRSPSSYNFAPLRDEIVAVLTGEKSAEKRSNRGRPKKAGGDAGARFQRLFDSCLTDMEYSLTPGESYRIAQPRPQFDEHKPFEKLVPVYPREKWNLWGESAALRCADVLCPVGKGQRGIVAASPWSDRAEFIRQTAKTVSVNHPEAKLVVLLVEERPEDATEIRRSLPASAEIEEAEYGESPQFLLTKIRALLDRAKSQAKAGADVFVIADGLNRLDQIASNAGDRDFAKRFFQSARKLEDGGSLTVLSIFLNGKPEDDKIIMEYAEYANMGFELIPGTNEAAIVLSTCNTKHSDLLLGEDARALAELARRTAGRLGEDFVREVFAESGSFDEILKTLRSSEM